MPRVTPELAAALRKHVPGEGDEAVAGRRALTYLALVAEPDPRSGYWPFHQEAAALCRGDRRLAIWQQARVEALLEALARHVPLAWVRAVPRRSCTQVMRLDLPPALQALLESEPERRREMPPKARLVDPGTGRPPARDAGRQRRAEALEVARASVPEGAPEEVVALLHDLNALPTDRFTDCLTSAEDALFAMAREQYDGRGYLSVDHALRAALAVRAPVYKMTERTLRLSPACSSAVTLRKALRRRTFPKALEIDMASAQLALAASLWDVPAVRDFLREARDQGKSWWDELIGHLRATFPGGAYRPSEHYGLVKGALKGTTYGIIFTMAIRNLRRFGNPDRMRPKERADYDALVNDLEGIFGADIERIGQAVLEHPLVSRLLEKRGKATQQIRRRKGARDCFGRWIPTSASGKEGSGDENEGRPARSVLAEVMQNAELFVMLRVGRRVLDDPELQMLLWQHDGLTLRPRRRSRPSDYRCAVRKAREALEEGLRALEAQLDCPEIVTWLTVDYAPEGKGL